MANFDATFTVKPVPVVDSVSPSSDPNIELHKPSSAVITLIPSAETNPDPSDLFSLTFVPATGSGLTFEDPPWASVDPLPGGVTIPSPITLNPSMTEFVLVLEVEKSLITARHTIHSNIFTSIGPHDPSIVIDPPPPN